jgi:PhzF family phenazine biosynthesis protein
MTDKCYVYQVDVFTRTPMEGNAAGVVPRADSLTSKQMQAIARELNNSETAFLLRPESDDHDVRIRYFTPTMEVPTCGHATIAAHYVRARTQNLAADRYWHKIGIGRLPVDIERKNSDYRIIMTQGRPLIDAPLSTSKRKAVLDALNIGTGDTVPDFPIVKVDTGASKILVGVKSRDLLNNIAPNYERLKSLGASLNCTGFFVFSLTDSDPDVISHCRMFAPQIGIFEDPVTGNGNGPLGAYLTHFNLIDKSGPTVYFRSRQGESMGRPGTAHVWVDLAEGQPQTVRVGGDAVVVFEAELTI